MKVELLPPDERYVAIMSRSWKNWIVKTIDANPIECGLYCEEYPNCDFYVDFTHNCFIGSFRENSSNGEENGQGHQSQKVYGVFKSKNFLCVGDT